MSLISKHSDTKWDRSPPPPPKKKPTIDQILDIQLTWSMRIPYSKCALTKLNWLLLAAAAASSCDKQKWHSFAFSLGWKGIILELDIASQNVPYKTSYWTKIAALGIISFSEKVTSYTLTL